MMIRCATGRSRGNTPARSISCSPPKLGWLDTTLSGPDNTINQQHCKLTLGVDGLSRFLASLAASSAAGSGLS
jgi:hypothetical protein